MKVEIRNLLKAAGNLVELREKLVRVSQTQLSTFGFQLVALAMVKSPVDTGRFRAAWQMQSFVPSGTIAGVIITNNTHYAGVLERGSKKGRKPWPNAGPKTVARGGRIYSSQAPGGVLTPALPEQAKKIAKAIIQGI